MDADESILSSSTVVILIFAVGGGVLGAAAGVAAPYFIAGRAIRAAASSLPSTVRSMVGFFNLSPLHYAILVKPAAACALIERSVNRECTCSFAEISGLTPLHLAALFGRAEVIQKMLAKSDWTHLVHAEDTAGNIPDDVVR